MRVAIRFLCTVALVAIMNSCKSDKNNISDIKQKYYNLEKIGWKSREYQQQIKDMKYTAIEVPIQYYLLKSIGTDNIESVDTNYEQNKSERIIEFTFSSDKDDSVLLEKYTGLSKDNSLKYMAFGLDKDFYLVTSANDTIRCAGVNYERSYEIAPYERVLLFFTGVNPEEKIQLVYDDYLFKNGRLKFQFKDPYIKIAL